MEQRGPAPKPTNLKQLYRAHERRVPVDIRGRSVLGGWLLVREQNPNTDSDEPEPRYPTNNLGIHIFGDYGARENT